MLNFYWTFLISYQMASFWRCSLIIFSVIIVSVQTVDDNNLIDKILSYNETVTENSGDYLATESAFTSTPGFGKPGEVFLPHSLST